MDNLRPPPHVRIVSPRPGTKVKAGKVQLKVLVADQGGGASPLWIYHNGHRLPRKRGAVATGGKLQTVEVELVEGQNHVRVTAFNAERSVEARGDELSLVWDVPPREKPVLHIVAAGVVFFHDASPTEIYAVALADALPHSFAPGLFGKVNPVTLIDRDASRANILAELAKLATTARPRDVVIAYLAGHGTLVGKRFYYLPWEASVGSDADIRATGLSERQLGEALVTIPARKQLVVLDACHSGASAKALGSMLASRDAVGLVRAQQRLARSAGSFLVAAATAAQYAKEIPELGHGVLTFAFLSGLGLSGKPPQASVGRDGSVTVTALLSWLDEEVPRLTTLYHGGRQNPVQASTGQDFPVVLAK